MNKNTTIGILIIIVLFGLGYYMFHKSDEANVAVVPVVTDTSPQNTNTPPAPVVPAARNPGVPVVETSPDSGSSNSTASVTGKVKPNGSPTTYWYEYGQTQALGSRTPDTMIGAGYAMISAPGYITGLRANTAYSYRLNARNSFGTVNGTIYALETNSNPAPKGTVPSVRTGTATTTTRVSTTLNGTVSPNGAPTTYWFEYGPDANFGSLTAFLVADGTTGQVAISTGISGLNPATRYYYRLNAQNQYGTVLGTTANFVTGGPAAITAPTATTTAASNVNTTSATLNGRLTTGGSDTTYWFEYSADSLLGSLIGSGTTRQTMNATTDTKSVSADITSLSRGTRYYYRLVTQNASGTVSGSIVSFKTK